MITPDELRFAVLGPLRMTVGSTQVPLGTPKQRAVLAMLLVNANRAVAADSLISAVWEDKPPPAARATLHAYVSNLRRHIADAGVDPRAVLASAPPGYRLDVAGEQYDLGRFAAGMQAGVGAAAGRRFEQASRHLTAALAEWRGPVLDDLADFIFIDPVARALAEDKVVAQIAHAEAEIACGRANVVIGELEALTAGNPYREPLWAQLITAYYVAERQSDALDAYHRLRMTLNDDLGIDPAPTIRDLYDRILHQETLDVQKAAQVSAEVTIIAMEQKASVIGGGSAALRDADGTLHPLGGKATRIGRSADNDLVLADAKVSRHHAVINDTGTGFTITDLGSVNGVYVAEERIQASADLTDGDHLRIGDSRLTFVANLSDGGR